MSPIKGARGYKVQLSNAFSGQLRLVSDNQVCPSKSYEVIATDGVAQDDSGGDLSSSDTDASSSQATGSEDVIVCLRNVCTKKSNKETPCAKNSIQTAAASTTTTKVADSSESDVSSEESPAPPRQCKKKQKGKACKKQADSGVEGSTDSAGEASAESETPSESTSAAASSEDASENAVVDQPGGGAATSEGEEASGTISEATQAPQKGSPSEHSEGTQTMNDSSTVEETSTDTDKSQPIAEAQNENEEPVQEPPETSTTSSVWTPSKDVLLLSMKDGGEAWATIASALAVEKGACRARWKEIGPGVARNQSGDSRGKGNGKHKAEAAASAPEKGDKAAQVAATDVGATADSNVAPRNDNAKDATNGVPAATGPDAEAPKKQKAKKTKQKTEKRKDITEEKNPVKSGVTCQDGASSASMDWPGRDRVVTWLGVHGRHYASPVAMGPPHSSGWAEEDSEVLRTLERKHRVERWLELQADFFNATGRMVSIEILQAKAGE